MFIISEKNNKKNDFSSWLKKHEIVFLLQSIIKKY
jgi:hypothetical protein